VRCLAWGLLLLCLLCPAREVAGAVQGKRVPAMRAKRPAPPRVAPRKLRPKHELARPRLARAPFRKRVKRWSKWPSRVVSATGLARGFQRFARVVGPVLGDASIISSGSRVLTYAQPAIIAVGGVGGVALAAASGFEFSRARSRIERADAAHGVAWGLQSLGSIGASLWAVPRGVETAALGLGVIGGGIQTAVGLYRLRNGLKAGDRRSLILGALDTGAGLSWVASTVTGNPAAFAAFVGFNAVRLTYTNWPNLVRLAGRAGSAARRLLDGMRLAGHVRE
jgi:hypothetical protein